MTMRTVAAGCRSRRAPTSRSRRRSTASGATWLDRQLLAKDPPLSGGGFGAEVREAMEARIDHLAEEGLARRQGQRVVFARDLLATLRRREIGGRRDEALGRDGARLPACWRGRARLRRLSPARDAGLRPVRHDRRRARLPARAVAPGAGEGSRPRGPRRHGAGRTASTGTWAGNEGWAYERIARGSSDYCASVSGPLIAARVRACAEPSARALIWCRHEPDQDSLGPNPSSSVPPCSASSGRRRSGRPGSSPSSPSSARPGSSLFGWPIYLPPAFFWWWFAYDAYAHDDLRHRRLHRGRRRRRRLRRRRRHVGVARARSEEGHDLWLGALGRRARDSQGRAPSSRRRSARPMARRLSSPPRAGARAVLRTDAVAARASAWWSRRC